MRLRVIRPESFGYFPRVSGLIEFGLAKPDGEGPYRARGLGLHQGHHEARVHAARKKRAQRHVRDHLVTHG